MQTVIGVGGFATVYRAYDDALDDSVAIKVLAENWAADGDIRDRFVEEARLLRRIRSEDLITVHDIGELDDGRPYFVMEFADGGSLAGRFAGRGSPGLDRESARRLIESLAGGLAELHRAGLVHRDVNPKNILLRLGRSDRTEDRQADVPTRLRPGLIATGERLLLADLGIAKDTMRDGAPSIIGGTPGYLAPEQATIEGIVQPATDVFSATGVLWEAIVGTPPPEPSQLERSTAAVEGPWRDFLGRGLAADPRDRYSDMESWRDSALGCLEDGVITARLAGRRGEDVAGPYKGLSAFQPEDADHFYGRDELVTQLLDRLSAERVLVVGGPSGSGKSSLVRAGLIPGIAAGRLPNSERWPIALFTPRSDPLGELAFQLRKMAGTITQGAQVAGSVERLRHDPGERRLAAEAVTDVTGGLLLVVDQFEEIFTQGASRSDREEFIEALAALVEPTSGRIRLVIAVRADFYGVCASFPWLASTITANQVLVGPMTRPELRQAIELPAHRSGLQLEAGLVEAVLDEGGDQPGALPLVSHAMAETWRRRQGNRLTLGAYQAAGGVAGAIAQTAESLYSGRFDAAEQAACRRLMLRLVSPGEGTSDSRRPVPSRELTDGSDQGTTARVAEALVDARLLTADAETVEIAHEALLRTWPRLRRWVDESRDDLRMRQHIQRARTEWEDQRRDPDLLYRGTPLQSALEWAAVHGDVLTSEDQAFLDAGRQARKEADQRATLAARRSRKIRRIAVVGLAGLAVVAGIAWIIALGALSDANQQFAQSLATQAAGLVDEDPRLALALAVEADARGDSQSLEGRAAMVDASRVLATATLAPAGSSISAGDALTVAVRPDGGLVVTGYRDGTIRLWDPATNRPIGPPLSGHDGSIEEAVFTPDGLMLLTVGEDATLRRWDLREPNAAPAPETLGIAGSNVWSVAVDATGQAAATAGEDGTVRLWDLTSGAQVGAPLAETTTDYLTVAFSPDGGLLMAGTGSGEITGWSLPDRAVAIGPWQAHQSDVWEIVFDPSGRTFATASSDGRIRLWATENGTLLHQPLAGLAVDLRGVQFDAEGRLLVAGDEDGDIHVWDVEEEQELSRTLLGHAGQVLDAAASADGELLASLGLDQTLRIWKRGQEPLGRGFPGQEEGAYGVAVSPDGALIATGDGLGSIRIFEAATGESTIGPLPLHQGPVWAVQFSADGTQLGSAAADGTVAVTDVRSGEQLPAPGVAHEGTVFVLVHADGRWVSGGDDRMVRIWDDGGGLVGELGPHAGAVTAMALSPSGVLAVADRSGRVWQWDIDDQSTRGEPLIADDNTVWGISWSDSGDLLATASADEVVTVWDLGDRSVVSSLTPHPGGATGVAFLADGVSVATVSGDGSVRLWDLQLGRPLGQPVASHDGPAWRVVAHPADSRFVTSSTDGNVWMWDVLDLDRACQRSAGALDLEQRRRFLGSEKAAAGCGSPGR